MFDIKLTQQLSVALVNRYETFNRELWIVDLIGSDDDWIMFYSPNNLYSISETRRQQVEKFTRAWLSKHNLTRIKYIYWR